VTAGIRDVASKLFRKEAMGRGDIKFMAAVGAFVGWDGFLISFFAGSVLGAIYGVLHQRLTGEREI
jgi:leader peptidase (prepilin peptidase)/N-methyltransferase